MSLRSPHNVPACGLLSPRAGLSCSHATSDAKTTVLVGLATGTDPRASSCAEGIVHEVAARTGDRLRRCLFMLGAPGVARGARLHTRPQSISPSTFRSALSRAQRGDGRPRQGRRAVATGSEAAPNPHAPPCHQIRREAGALTPSGRATCSATESRSAFEAPQRLVVFSKSQIKPARRTSAGGRTSSS